MKLNQSTPGNEFILVLDEIQKIKDWTEIVKKLWDEDSRGNIPIKTVLLGSSPLLLQKGLHESLGGRFELIRLSHWSFKDWNIPFTSSKVRLEI